MSFDGLLVHTVTVLQAASTTDRYGDATPDWTTATSTETPARIVQRSATELLENRDADITEWVAFLPGDVEVEARDRIEWGTRTYEVTGEAKPAVRRSAAIHHLEVPLKRVEG